MQRLISIDLKSLQLFDNQVFRNDEKDTKFVDRARQDQQNSPASKIHIIRITPEGITSAPIS